MLKLTELKQQMNHKEEEIGQKNERILAYEEKTKIMKLELKEVARKAASQVSYIYLLQTYSLIHTYAQHFHCNVF